MEYMNLEDQVKQMYQYKESIGEIIIDVLDFIFLSIRLYFKYGLMVASSFFFFWLYIQPSNSSINVGSSDPLYLFVGLLIPFVFMLGFMQRRCYG